MERKVTAGFTLIELIAMVAVMAILLAVGVPSFTSAVKNSRTSGQYNDMVAALYLARSEAVKSASMVTVCARASDTQCGTDWNQGWIVYLDEAFAPYAGAASIGNEDTILALYPALDGENTVDFIGSTNNTASAAAQRKYVTYAGTGQSNWRSATFAVCDDRGPEESRAANVVLTGDIRPGRKSAGATMVSDVFGRNIDAICN